MNSTGSAERDPSESPSRHPSRKIVTPSRSLALGMIVLAGGISLAACSNNGSSSGDSSTSASASTSPNPSATVTATILGQSEPPNAPGQKLTLYTVSVPPGASIAPHDHPGLQIGSIQSGTLTYTVLQGTVTVVDGTSNGQPGPKKEVSAPATLTLGPGQTLYEPDGEYHMAKNLGSEPVVIQLASLVPKDDGLSQPAPTTVPTNVP